MMRGGVARPELLVRAGARDVDGHAAVLARAADEAVAEHARLVADDLEIEGADVPLRGLAGIRSLQVDVIDAERHGGSPFAGREGSAPTRGASEWRHPGPGGPLPARTRRHHPPAPSG